MFLRGRKLNISLAFISQYCFKVPKITKIPSKRELQRIASIYSSDIEFKDFMKLYEDYTKEPYSFLVSDTTLSSNNPLRFKKNLL